jgi:hypothetical protein
MKKYTALEFKSYMHQCSKADGPQVDRVAQIPNTAKQLHLLGCYSSRIVYLHLTADHQLSPRTFQ